MDRFTWVPGFDVGIEQMNGQHRALFQKMQDLDTLNHKSAPKANVLAAFDELLHLTEQHFASEEKTMQDLGFVDFAKHKALHTDLLQKLKKYRTEFQHSVYGALPSSVFDFFQNWLMTHILIADKAYGPKRKD